MAIIYKLVESELDFFNLKSSWEELEKLSGSSYPSISFKWCSLWWKVFKNTENNTIGFKKKIAIICGYEKEKLTLVVPLMILQRGIGRAKITFLEFLGQQWGSISYTVLKLHDFDLYSLINFINNNISHHILYLRQIPLNESGLFLHDLRQYSGSPFVNLNDYESKDDYRNKNYSKSLKQNIRTAHNRISKNNLTLDFVIEDINDNNFDDIIRLSKMKLLDKKQSLYKDQNKASFYKEIFSHFSSNVVFVKLNNAKIAYRANILYNNQKTCIDASYDRNYKKFDPGIISVDYNLTDSFLRKLNTDNLGPGLDDYKLKFTNKIQYLGYLLVPGKRIGSKVLTLLFDQLLRKKLKSDI